jgi:molybdopterin converting factor small subunit
MIGGYLYGGARQFLLNSAMHVRVELWLGLGRKEAEAAGLGSGMCARLDLEAEEGTTVRELFGQLAGRYRPVAEHMFDDETGEFRPDVLVTVNDRIVGRTEVCDVALLEGDKVAVFPLQIGG